METGLKGPDARKHIEDFVRDRMDNHWEKVPDPRDGNISSSHKPTIRSKVVKVDKVKEPGLNEKLYKIPNRKRIETVTREQTPPPPIGEDPQVVVTAEEPVLEEPVSEESVSEEPISEEPVFEPPTRVLPTDDEYVHSIETLTAEARATSESEKVKNGTSVKVQLPLNLDYVFSNDELVQSTTMLETIMGSMTNLHSNEDLSKSTTAIEFRLCVQ